MDAAGARPDQDRFRQLVEDVLDWAWETDRNGIYTYASPQVRRLLGFPPEEIVGRSPFDLMPKSEAQRTRKIVEGYFARREPFALLRNVNQHRDGREITLETSGVPFFDASGQFAGYRGFDRDISAHMRVEKEMLESRAMLQTVLDAIPVRVFWKDLELRYLGCNARFAADAGLPDPGSIVGRNDHDLAWREQAELYRGDDRSVIDSGVPKINYEEPQSGPDGASLWLRTSKIPLRDRAQRIVGVLGCYEDISRRKEAERTLLRYEQIVSVTSDRIAFFEPAGIHVAVNPAYAEAFGLSVEEIVGRDLEQIDVDSELRGPIGALLARCASGEQLEGRQWIVFPHAGRRFVDARCTPFRDDGGDVAGIVLSIRDLTDWKHSEEERKRLEAGVLHSQKLESLGVLAGGIAHDFNNLLTGVLGNAELAGMELPQSSPARQHLRNIEKAALRAADLCQQMLAYSGKGRFQIEPLNLTEIVEEMTELLHVSIAKTASLERHLPRGLPLVEADAAQLRQVVMNLITNASEALVEESGTISVSTGSVQCDRATLDETISEEDLPEGEYVYLQVVDDGAGMDDETRERLFDPFFTTKFTGRGLGMAAVLGILRGHRGAIRVESAPGDGTLVRILLPTTCLPAERNHYAAPPAIEWRGAGTVLVVDDEETVRTTAVKLLESAGFSALTANDGREATELFRKRSREFVAVLLDLTMPVLGGEETLRELKRIDRDVVVVLCSGYNEEEVAARFGERGPAAFVQKPFRRHELLSKLRGVLGD